jgi:hypothetical protein
MTEQTTTERTIDLAELRTLELDLSQITLGEMSAIELASGHDFVKLLKGGATSRRLIALYLREWRSSGREPSWSEISGLRPLAAGSSSSPSSSDGPSATSNG